MKKLLSLLLVSAICVGICSGCRKTPTPLEAPEVPITPEASQTVNSALNSFGLDLLRTSRELQTEQTGILLSPLSAALALSTAANGADGETLSEFEALLGGGADLSELNGACTQLMEDYQKLKGSTKSSIANSLWADPGGQISEDFIGICKGVFDAEVFQTKLSDPAIVPQLNSWVNDKTQKMIPKLIDQPFPEAAAVMVNALYLENRFVHEFDPNSTRLRPFFHADGTREDKDFMHDGLTSYPYIKGSGVQGVILPYDDGRLGFAALLPDEDLDTWLSSLSGTELSDLFLSAQEDTLFLNLAVPKFEFEWDGSLVEPLREMGLELPFLEGAADFSKLGIHPDGYYLSDVLHATKIEVKEKGTKAAAVTAVVATPGAAPLPPDGVTLILDRPFLYGIVDLQTGLPLFLGTFE